MLDYNYIKKENQEKVKKLMTALDKHSHETFLHSLEVANICLYLAKASCMDIDSQCLLYTAGCLHDVGKMKIPKTLLHKKSSDEKEVDFIKRYHIRSTYKILKGHFDKTLVNTCFHHHERINGTGYPRGLKANQLNEYDRIIAIADIASAMLLKRSYRDFDYSTDQVMAVLDNLSKSKGVDERYVLMLDGYMKMLERQSYINENVLPDNKLEFKNDGQLDIKKKNCHTMS